MNVPQLGRKPSNLATQPLILQFSLTWYFLFSFSLLRFFLIYPPTEKPVWPAAAARSTTLLEVMWKMTSEWDACSQTRPAPIWQPRSKEAAAFECTRGTVWSSPIRWCRVKTRPSTPQRTTGRRPASTRHWWGSVWSTGGWFVRVKLQSEGLRQLVKSHFTQQICCWDLRTRWICRIKLQQKCTKHFHDYKKRYKSLKRNFLQIKT